MKPLISFKNFTFKYDALDIPTLFNINLDIYDNEKILIIGPSGSGKSTLSNCINGLIPFSYKGKIQGQLLIDGLDLVNSSIFELSKIVGTVLQDSDGQFVGMTVAEDVAFALENDNKDHSEMLDIVDKAISLTNLSDFKDHPPMLLSGGQKQRTSISGILVDDVKIMLFDEPLANLDPKTGKNTISLIENIKSSLNKTIIIIEHRLEDVLWSSIDRIILINDGTIKYNGNIRDLLMSNLLNDNGIREPLYVTAMKYAKVALNNIDYLENINHLKLNKDAISTISNWYYNYNLKDENDCNQPLLSIKDLTFSYKDNHKLIDKLSLNINKGEIISIVGENGAGKSTLSKLICGFEKPESGKIILNNIEINKLPIREIAKNIGFIMQNPNTMISKISIYDEIALGLLNIGLTSQQIKDKVYEVMKICKLYEFRNWPIKALSHGQKKRVTIASVLVLDPSIIILDEPTAGQDFKTYTIFMDFLLELNKLGTTIILITHNMHLMLEYTKRVIVMSNGTILKDTTASKLLSDMFLIDKSSLKETSLYTLANLCNIDPISFIDKFIAYDKECRKHE